MIAGLMRIFPRGRGIGIPWVAGAALSLVILVFVIGVWVRAYDRHADDPPRAGNWGIVQHVLRYGVEWSSAGAWQKPVKVDGRGLLPGDVVLGSMSNGSYGYFTHATAFIGAEEVLGLNISYGIYPVRFTDLRGYKHVRVMRADLSASQRRAVAHYLRRLVGAVFQVTAHKRDPRVWTCAKAVWAAYQSVHIDLVSDRDFLVPDDIARSRALKTVREWKSL